jgi:nitrile hydratase accessory protein
MLGGNVDHEQTTLMSELGAPCAGESPVFAEPWQAQAFAITVHLEERGLFTWGEWAQELGVEILAARKAGDPDDGSTYYRHWLATLERLVAAKGLASKRTLDALSDAWGRAADRTPHGQPIELSADDLTPR